MIAARTIAANTSYTECCFKKTVDTHINKPQIAVMIHTFFLCLPKVFELNTANSITKVLYTCRLGRTLVGVSALCSNFTRSVQKLSRGKVSGLKSASPLGNTKYIITAIDMPIIRAAPILTHSPWERMKNNEKIKKEEKQKGSSGECFGS